MDDTINQKSLLLVIDEKNSGFDFHSSIEEALGQTSLDLEQLSETIDSIRRVKSEADKIDYMLAVGAGSLLGLIDIFLVGKPGESPTGKITDQWFENRTKDFARITGWTGGESKSVSSAIRYLEKNLMFLMIKVELEM